MQGRALKEERERSWQVRLEEKKAEDEELRQLRIAVWARGLCGGTAHAKSCVGVLPS